MRVSVRGIYSTGLIKFLLDKGYEVTKLSEKQKERFRIYSEEEPDVFITDLKDKTGIIIRGANAYKVVNDFKEIFWDSFYIRKYEKIKEGKYIKITNNGINFENISNEKKKELLKALSDVYDGSFGIYFKSSCENAAVDDIIQEITELIEKKEEIYYVYFGYNSKIILDKLRSKVIPTLKNHHMYRKDLSDILDFAEILLQEVEEEKIINSIKKYIAERIKDRGIIYRYHRKPDGSYIKYLEIIKEININNKLSITTLRIPKPYGTYDGLNKPIEPGDYAITHYLEGSWFFEIRYYDKNNKLKGKYININTPLEITGKIQYLDLAIDVIETEKKVIVDKEELDKIYKDGVITKELYEKAKQVAEELL